MIPVTKTFLPSIDEYTGLLKQAWQNQWITNRGELVLDLERKLKTYLSVPNIIITNNGTIPLQIALKLFGECGEIITTPFSYIATTAAIMWENCKPVFVDIDREYLTIDETLIEAAITSKTTAILATHVFGNPCNVHAIAKIAEKHNLKVIYDAAHCFGVKFEGESIFNYGDISTCSFHATKLFHTAEGGALFCKNDTVNHQLFYSHNFGHKGHVDFHGLGINGKMSELQAAMGLAVLSNIGYIITERKKVVEFYDNHLDTGLIKTLRLRSGTSWNYSYYPVVVESETRLIEIVDALNLNNIFPRRYFYPSLNTVKYINGDEMPVSESIAKRILCLPLFVGLLDETLSTICKTLNSSK